VSPELPAIATRACRSALHAPATPRSAEIVEPNDLFHRRITFALMDTIHFSVVRRGRIMRFISSRPAIAVAVVVATVLVCFLGIRAELREANYSVREHFAPSGRADNAAPALVAGGGKRGADPAPPR
jgi:hypothetical protein